MDAICILLQKRQLGMVKLGSIAALVALCVSLNGYGEGALKSDSRDADAANVAKTAVIAAKESSANHQDYQNLDRGYMNDFEFNVLYTRIKNKPFKNDKLELVEVGSLDSRFSCRQCADIMLLFSFDDEKMAVLEFMAPHVVDRENAGIIMDNLSFSSSREKAASLLF